MNVKRDIRGIAHIVGISGGKDSVALATRLQVQEPRPYTYIYTPTGNELPEMESHMRHVETLLGEPILRLSNGTLESQIEANQMLPNVFARWCTRLLKLKPAGEFYQQFAPVVCYVGLRADEDEREGTRPGGDSASIQTDVVQRFPFQEWGWGLDEVLAWNEEQGIAIPERTDCAWCPYQRLGEWYNLWDQHPLIYQEGEEIEADYGHTFRSPGRDTWPASLKELRECFEAGEVPERSLRMMEKRHNMCRACSL